MLLFSAFPTVEGAMAAVVDTPAVYHVLLLLEVP